MTIPMPRSAAIEAAFLDSCAQIVGAANLVTNRTDTAACLTDWTGAYSGQALAVARPASTAEVSALVRQCAEAGITVVPQGGGTGLAGGGVPCGDRQSLILSLGRMNQIRAIDTEGRSAIAEAGVVLETLQTAVEEQGLVYPLMFGARGSCMIGGTLSTNAGGSNVVKHGTARSLCLGIEAVLPDGSVINTLSSLRKDNTGYDLRDLLIGAEGTLGIITAAALKLLPRPKVRATAFLSLRSLDDALETLNAVQDRTGGAVEAFEYVPQPVIDAILRAFPQTRPPLDGSAETGILIEVTSTRQVDADTDADGTPHLQSDLLTVLEAQMESGAILDAVLASSERQRDALWQMRESVLEAITQAGPAYHFDLALPLASVPEFVTRMNARVAALGFRTLTIGHLGDGNLHYALAAPEGVDFAGLPLEKAKSEVMAMLGELHGSFSAEHGIGQSKLPLMRAFKDPAQLVAMRAIKRALDPLNIMNPGKLIPDVATATQ